jgi:hypothetical protein
VALNTKYLQTPFLQEMTLSGSEEPEKGRKKKNKEK